MFKKIVYILIIMFLFGCSSSQQTPPEETPEKVVEQFFKLLSEGGPTSLAEARKMISDKYYMPSESSFKKWVENYPSSSEIKNLKSTIIKNKRDEVVAQVTLDYTIPSEFGGTLSAKSTMNLILDNKSNTWKIDFTGETMPEESHEDKAG